MIEFSLNVLTLSLRQDIEDVNFLCLNKHLSSLYCYKFIFCYKTTGVCLNKVF